MDSRVRYHVARTTAVALSTVGLLAAVGACRIAALGGWYVPLPVCASAAGPTAAPGTEKRLAAPGPAAPRPAGIHVVVDTYSNRLRVYRGRELLREAVCSTGSGVVLRDPSGPREWVFDTPRGERRVERKVRDPVWFKPDWAFIEEGVEPPPAGSRERVDDVSLGSYGLYLGDGYIIHGTLFQTLLGQRVTHGCIRLGDADLEFVYETVPVGARVFLF